MKNEWIDPTTNGAPDDAVKALSLATYVAQIIARIESLTEDPPAGCLPHDFHRAPKATQ